MRNQASASAAQPSPLRTDEIEFSFLLGDVTRKLRRTYDAEMQRLGLTRSQWQVLVRVLRMQSPTQTELADAPGI